WDRQASSVTAEVRRAIERAADRIARFHAPQRVEGYRFEEGGARLELRVQPLERVGLYVPGGSARYPSSVLMTAVPARIAGVHEIVMVTPGPSAVTLYAAKVAGVHRVFVIGGAQAVAALAFGTESVPRVDKIVGPGNAWVAEAKRQLFGQVDIDAVAGPSEILVIADDAADPALVAADLLSQAEHDVAAYAVLLATSGKLAEATARAVDEQLATLPRKEIAAESIRRHGVALVMRTLDDALKFAERYAPEHLELMVRDADDVAHRVMNAGAIFVGTHTPEAAGDYLAGPNHVLPTGGTARYAAPLGVYDFVKRTSVLRWDDAALDANESPYPLSRAAMEAMAKELMSVELTRYPDASAIELRWALAARAGVAVEELMLGNGSDELIALLCATFAEPRAGQARAKIAYAVPGFVVCRTAALAHGLEP